MRWTKVPDGFERRVTRFLWAPKTIGGEARWLERASWWEQKMPGFEGHWWLPLEWADDEPRYTLTEAGRKHLEEG